MNPVLKLLSKLFKFQELANESKTICCYPPLEGYAIVDENIDLALGGRVLFQDSFWQATCDQALEKGELVYVRGLDKKTIRLIVEPVKSENFHPFNSADY